MTQQDTKQEEYSIQTADPVWLREEAEKFAALKPINLPS